MVSWLSTQTVCLFHAASTCLIITLFDKLSPMRYSHAWRSLPPCSSSALAGLLDALQQAPLVLHFCMSHDFVLLQLNFVGTVLNQQLGKDANSQQYGYGQQQQQDAQIQGLLNKQQSNNRHLLSFLDGINQDVNNKVHLACPLSSRGQSEDCHQYASMPREAALWQNAQCTWMSGRHSLGKK